ncbi:MAG: glycosyltransferase family 9 protein [Nitrospirota bacterium]
MIENTSLIEKIKNILVLMPEKHMGNLVVSLPAIMALKEFFKEKIFFLVIDRAYKDILEPLIGRENLLLFPRKQLRENSFAKKMRIFFQFLHQLRSTSPDVAIDLEGRHASSMMAFLSGAPLRIGRSTAERPYLYNLKVDLSTGKHKVYSYIEIAAAIGVQSETVSFRLQASDTHRTSLKSVLFNEGITTDKPIISIHPGAGKIYKQWASDGFAKVSDWLSSKGFQVVFVGSSGDLNKINEISSFLKHQSYNLGGMLSIGELMALFEMSSLYIGNDSGPMHLAAAMGIPVIALFGPGINSRWRPLTEKAVVLRGTDRCQKCKGKDCQYDFKCISTLSFTTVKKAIEKIIFQKIE